MKVLLHGELEYMPLPDLLQWVEMNRKSCVVKVEYNETNSTLFVEEGRIIYASSQKPGCRLGDFMIAGGLMRESSLAQHLEESRKCGKFFTRYLIEGGHVSNTELTGILARMVDALLMEIFRCESGSFTVAAPLPENVLNGPIRLNISELIMDALQKMDKKERNSQVKNDSLEKINRRLQADDFELPVLPTMIAQLMAVMENENANMRDMAKIIMTDQVLISCILKIANSALYSTGGKIDSIPMAIARLGMREIMRIVTAIKVSGMKVPNAPGQKLRKILDDALKTALVASEFARHLRLDPEEAFLGGLMHDLGETVILSLAGGDCTIEEELLDEFIAERHAEIGARIAGTWNYPESIQNIILRHHEPAGAGNNQLVAVLQIADSMIKSGEECQCSPEALATLNLNEAVLLDVFGKAMDAFSQLKSFESVGK